MQGEAIKINLPCGAWLILSYCFTAGYDLATGKETRGWTLVPDLVFCRWDCEFYRCPWIEVARCFFRTLCPREMLAHPDTSSVAKEADLENGKLNKPTIVNDDPRFGDIPFLVGNLGDEDFFTVDGCEPYKGQKLIRNPKGECPYFGKSFDPFYKAHSTGIIAFFKRLIGRRK